MKSYSMHEDKKLSKSKKQEFGDIQHKPSYWMVKNDKMDIKSLKMNACLILSPILDILKFYTGLLLLFHSTALDDKH